MIENQSILARHNLMCRILEADISETRKTEQINDIPTFKDAIESIYQIKNHPDLTEKFIIAFGGGFSAGKSSLINAILNKRLLPTEIDPTTSLSTYIISGTQDKIEVDSCLGEKTEVSHEEFLSLTHDEDTVYSRYFSTLLSSAVIYQTDFQWGNLAFLDTPGYSKFETQGSYLTDQEKSRSKLNRADAIIWVTDIRQGCINEEDLKFLSSLDNTCPVLHVLSHADQKSDSEMQQVVEHIKATLGEKKLPYLDVIAVSARKKKDLLIPLIEQLTTWNKKFLKGLGSYQINTLSMINQFITELKHYMCSHPVVCADHSGSALLRIKAISHLPVCAPEQDHLPVRLKNGNLVMLTRKEIDELKVTSGQLREAQSQQREINTQDVQWQPVQEHQPTGNVTAKLPLINAQGVAPINNTNYLQMLKSKLILHPYLVDLTSNLFFALKPNGDHTMLTRQELALPPELIDQKGTYALSGGSFKATEEKSLAQARKEVTYEFVQLPFDCKHVFFQSSVIGKYLPKRGEHKFPISISSDFNLLSKNETTSFENDKKVFDLIVKLKESVDPIGDLWYLLHTWFFKPETLPNCFSSTVYQQIEEMVTVGFNKTVALYMGLPFCRITNFGPRTKEDMECSYEDFAQGLEKRFGSMYASVIKSKEFFNILINMMFFKTPETDAIIAKGKEDGLLEADVFYSQRLAFKEVRLVNQQNFADLLMEGLVFTYFKDECIPSMLLKETNPLLHRFAEEAYMTNVGNINIELPLIIYLPKGKLYVSRSLLNNALLVTYLESGKAI